MTESLGRWVAACAVALLLSSAAAAQVAVGPEDWSGRAGRDVELPIVVSGATDVSAFGFNILYDATTAPYAPVLVPGSSNSVTCTVESDIADHISPLAFSFPSLGFIALSFGDFSFPITSMGREGTIATCTFHIADDAPLGPVSLVCDPSFAATTAADPNGQPIAATCQGATLTILPFLACCGDADGNGMISAAEATSALNAFGQRDPSLDPAADCNGDGMVSSSEATKVLNNFGQRECNP